MQSHLLRSRVAPAFIAAVSALGLAASVDLHAQVVVSNPAVVTGSNAINPSSEALGFYTGSSASTVSTLEADPLFRSLQDYSGFTGNTANNKTYTVDFGADQDVRFTYGSANNPASAAAISNLNYALSGTSALRLQGASASTASSMTIAFGTYDSGTGFTLNQTVTGVGFSFTGNYGNMVNDTVTVTYYSISGTALTTQTYTHAASTSSSAGAAGPVNAFTGYINSTGDAANNVSYLTIAFTTDTASPFIFGLDDFGFTTAAVPEPSSFALYAAASGLFFAASRRRRGSR